MTQREPSHRHSSYVWRALSRTRLPGLWRLSGWARRGLDADKLCARCYDRWSDGVWFWRWCRECRRPGRAEFFAAHLGDLHPCDEPNGWQEFEVTLSFYVTRDDPDVIERERQRIWAGLPDAVLEVADA